MGKTRRDDLTGLVGHIHWEVSEFALAAFAWRGRNSHGYNRLFLVSAGGGMLVNHTGGERFRFRAGYGFFMPPLLDLSFDFRADLRFHSIHFRVEALPGVDLFAGGRQCHAFRLAPDELDEAGRIAEARPGWEAFFGFEAFFARQLRRLAPWITTDWDWRERMRRRYGALLAYIREHADARTTTAELAAAAGRSYDALSRTFKRDFGQTLKHFVALELCRRAESWLRRDAPVKEVAARLGFGCPFYFSRFFHKHTGMPPDSYRRHHAGDPLRSP